VKVFIDACLAMCNIYNTICYHKLKIVIKLDAAASYVLQLYSEEKLNQVNVGFIIQETEKLIDIVIKKKFRAVQEILGDNNLDTDLLLRDAMTPAKSTIFSDVKNPYKQNKYFTRHFGMIAPREIVLPLPVSDFRRVRQEKQQVFKHQKDMVVSLLDQLQKNFNFPDVMAEIYKEKETKRGLYSTFEDGEAYRNSTVFQENPFDIQLQVYIDEVHICFEVGHHTKKNKLVFFYFTIGNLPTKFRSAFKFINVLAICYNTTLLEHGANVTLQPILDDIRKLEAGYEFVIGGERQIIHGTLAALVADNLASHQIGGFNVGFSNGFRKCRFCLTTREEIQEKFFYTEHIPRTKENHDMRDGLQDPDLQACWSTLYGIKNRGILNDLRGFHVIVGCVARHFRRYSFCHNLCTSSILRF
jgi:hypothetical protein